MSVTAGIFLTSPGTPRSSSALDAGLSSLDDFVIFPNLSGRNVLRVQFHVPLELKFCMRMKEKPVRMASLMLILRLAN